MNHRPMRFPAATLAAALAAVLALLAAPCPAQSPDDVLDTLHRAAAEADGETYFSLFSGDATFLGTDRRERWTFDEFETRYKPFMARGLGWTYRVRDRDLRVEGDVAWFDETLWNTDYGHCRGSGVLTKTDRGWKIRQYNLTFPVPNEASAEIVERSLVDDSTRLRVLTFNIRTDTPRDGTNAWPERADAALSLVRKTAPDVLGVQEATWPQLEALEDALPGYAWVGVDRRTGKVRGGGDEYAPIFYLDDRFDLADAGTFWLSPTPEATGSTGYGNSIPRIVTWAELLDPRRDETLLVVNTHFDHKSGESRQQSSEQIRAWVESRLAAGDVDDAVVLGDFNTDAGSDETAALRALGRPYAPKRGTFHGFTGSRSARGPAIDWLVAVGDGLVARNIRAMSREAEFEPGRYVSDHDPVLGDFDWAR
ncbi:MAG: nuclear transport factor 2 family protein [Planctomycetota bacterium]